jgi:hypothetical protein
MRLFPLAVSAALVLFPIAKATSQAAPTIASAPIFPAMITLNGYQDPVPLTVLQPKQTIIECERAIYVLKNGYRQRWQKPEQYIEAFKKSSDRGTGGDNLRGERERMVAYLALSLPERHAMDEQTPLDVQVTRTIRSLEKSRDEALSLEAKTAK